MICKLESLLKYEQPTKYIVASEDYSDEFVTPVLTAGKSFILGYTDEEHGVCKASINPVIIYDDFTTESKFVDFDFKVKSSAMKILHKINKDDNLKYLYYVVSCLKYKPFSHKRTWISDFSKFQVKYRIPEEQNKIVSELDKIQDALANKNEQLKKLDKLIQSKFCEMFGDPVLNDKRWDKEPLKNITTKIGSGATPKGGNESYKKDGVSLIRSMNVYNNYFNYKDLAYIDDIQAEGLKNVVVLENDILLNITGASVARSCIVPTNILPARVNQHVAIVRIKDNFSNIFISYQLTNITYQQELLTLSKGKGGTREALTKGQLEELLVILPPLPLQQAFASFVEKVEKAKAIVNKEIAHLQELLDSRMDFYFRK